MEKKEPKRCFWVDLNHSPSIIYHDQEWCVPAFDDRYLFEMFVLEGAQAGLSWKLILDRREHYLEAFKGFEIDKVAEMSDHELTYLIEGRGPLIIRNHAKILATRRNACVFQKIAANWGSFSDYIWHYTNNTQMINDWKRLEDIPARTDLSLQISKDLRKEGMTFVGPTIMYSYMQAIGMVSDHMTDCFLHPDNKKDEMPL